METINLLSLKTVLDEYELWFDGDITIEPQFIYDHVAHLDRVFVTQSNKDIDRYNQMVTPSQRISTEKHEVRPLNPSHWNIPDQYRELNVLQYTLQAHDKRQSNEDWDDVDLRKRRIISECELFEAHGLMPIIRTLIFIINTLTEHKQVWGTGRGSSVSSYVLYVLYVHDVDSYMYELDITDFIK